MIVLESDRLVCFAAGSESVERVEEVAGRLGEEGGALGDVLDVGAVGRDAWKLL